MRHRLWQIVLLLASAEAADARTWYVTPDGSGQAPTIQAAVDSCVDGDEVVLAPGTYTYATQGASENSMVNIRKNITLRGEAGAESTILDVQGNPARPIRCHAPATVLIDGLTLQGGNPPFEGGSGSGGIRITSGSTIQNCIIRNNRTDMIGSGAGISAVESTVRNCLVENNHAGPDGLGGGIRALRSLVIGCTVRGNSVRGDPGGSGGGIYSDRSEIVDCLIEDNLASGPFGGSGGGLDAVGGVIRGCTFVNNVARGLVTSGGRGGGVATGDIESVVISECLFIGNRTGDAGSRRYGGAIQASSSNTLIERCTILGNASGVGGGVIRNSIIAFSTEGSACDVYTDIGCSLLFGNVLGDAVCGTDSGGNLIADPQFCAVDPISSRNAAIQSDSPCANAPGCGQIGMSSVACDSVSIEAVPWSAVKSIFRR
jgi:hypothetical protein